MNSNQHNTIGPRQHDGGSLAPSTWWDIVGEDGVVVGSIEADYGSKFAHATSRASVSFVVGYNVVWLDDDREGWFSASAHGSAAKALAAAKRYAKGTTKAVR